MAKKNPAWLNPPENRAWRGFVNASQMLNTQVERDLIASSGLSNSDYAVLVCLSEVDENSLRSTEVAGRLSWSRSRLSHQVARMESRGLVRRENCGSDARGSFVILTDIGMRAIQDAAPDHVESVRSHLFDYLTDEQVAVLGDITAAIIDHVASLGELPEGCTSETITQSVDANSN